MNIFSKENKQKRKSASRSKGFVGIIVIIIIALVILHLAGIDIENILSKQSVKDFAIYVRDMLKIVWDDLKQIATFIRELPESK